MRWLFIEFLMKKTDPFINIQQRHDQNLVMVTEQNFLQYTG